MSDAEDVVSSKAQDPDSSRPGMTPLLTSCRSTLSTLEQYLGRLELADLCHIPLTSSTTIYSAISLCTLILVSLPAHDVPGVSELTALQYDLMPTNFIFMAFYFVLSKGVSQLERPFDSWT